jgi:hypothetical protein
VAPNGGPSGGPSPSPSSALSRLLAAAAADPVMATLLFRELIAAGEGHTLVALSHESLALERHLLALGHERPYTIPWAALGATLLEPLTEVQLLHMELLAEVFVARKELPRAVEVLAALGRAAVDPAVRADRRPDRVRCFADASFHVRLCSPCCALGKCAGTLPCAGALVMATVCHLWGLVLNEQRRQTGDCEPVTS